MVDRELIGVSQLGFTSGKLRQTNLVAICNRVTVLLDKARATVSPQTSADLWFSYNILANKLERNGFSVWTNYSMDKELAGQQQPKRKYCSQWLNIKMEISNRWCPSSQSLCPMQFAHGSITCRFREDLWLALQSLSWGEKSKSGKVLPGRQRQQAQSSAQMVLLLLQHFLPTLFLLLVKRGSGNLSTNPFQSSFCPELCHLVWFCPSSGLLCHSCLDERTIIPVSRRLYIGLYPKWYLWHPRP